MDRHDDTPDSSARRAGLPIAGPDVHPLRPVPPLHTSFPSSSKIEVGDLKVRFERVDLAEASFVGKQQGDALTAYKTSNGREVFLSAAGRKDAAAMFQQAQTENTIITWVIRVAGLIGIFIGFQLFFGLFGVIGDVIPFIGSIVRGGTTVTVSPAPQGFGGR